MNSLRGYWAILLTLAAALVAVAVGVFAYTGIRDPVTPSMQNAVRSLENRGPGDQHSKEGGDPMARQVAPNARQQSPPSPP
jgi:hypothetical protein